MGFDCAVADERAKSSVARVTDADTDSLTNLSSRCRSLSFAMIQGLPDSLNSDFAIALMTL